MAYCDTSLLIAALTQEPHTAAANRWLERQPGGSLWISPWVETEIASALAQKVRRGDFPPEHRVVVERVWRELSSAAFTPIFITTAHFNLATRFLDDHKLGLRAGDALHLAVASANRLSIGTLDDGMADAATLLSIPIAPIRDRS